LVSGRWDGAEIRWKLDFINPSGCFKDRGAAVMLNYLLAHGVKAIAEDSSGNGGAAMATYAAAAGISCRIYVREDTSRAKVTQIAATGAEVIRIPGTRQAVADAAMQDHSNRFYASHNCQALFLEGTKTAGYEIWEMLGHMSPDAIVVPVGGGSIFLGSYLAFSELRACGEVDQVPRLFGVQSEACMPIARAYLDGKPRATEIASLPTIAEGIAVSRPIRSAEIIAAAHETHGAVISVPEAKIRFAHGRLAKMGLYVEPTSAAAAAGLSQLLENRVLASGARIVVILTGSGLKASETIAKM
jgi:threonine synthase